MSSAPAAGGVLRLGLVGSPNSGKTTLFNALTGLRAKVANYPGVTVERREGETSVRGRRLVVVDLPGTYSLDPISPDERVVSRVLDGHLSDPPDALVMVADACSLERSLLVLAQVLKRGTPTCLVVTMTDELVARGGELDLPRLERALGIPVCGVVGHRGLGIGAMRELLARPEEWSQPHLPAPEAAAERAAWVESILTNVIRRRPGRNALTDSVDRVVLHPVAGSLLFVVVMVTFFQVIFAWATPAMDAIDAAIGVGAEAARAALPAGLLADFVADGLITGVGAVVIFLPQIVLLFSLLYLLQDVGYMARAAFVIDRLMGRVGLEGRSFVSLLSSYACAVPGIMATRTIPSTRNRMVTILVAPLMTCSARLPVFALLIGAFVPPIRVWGPIGLQGLTLLGLYLLGAVSALLVAAVLKRTLLSGESLPFYMELPSYRWPPLRLIASQVWGSASAFLRRAGTIILAATVVLWALLSFPRVTAPEPLRAGAQPGRPGGPRPGARGGTAGLRLEDRRRALREPGRPRGDRRDAGPDLRRHRPGDLAARGGARRRRPPHGEEGLHARHRGLPPGLLRVRAAVHVHPGGDPARDQLLALARLRFLLPAGARLRGELRHLPDRLGAGRRRVSAPAGRLRSWSPCRAPAAGPVSPPSCSSPCWPG
jgi:ferrous iron transport protein B